MRGSTGFGSGSGPGPVTGLPGDTAQEAPADVDMWVYALDADGNASDLRTPAGGHPARARRRTGELGLHTP
ncbi:hypothetical protein ACGF13_10575 [Kitasatospora sp. NPDC048286]|uniref:hypothetical protein n=1 Tax=Kitasatospora sp. NPDC048286 TaxID=3364047 RepID=UPI003715B425